MPNVSFENAVYPLVDGDSVLDCLLRNGIDIPNSCRSGACQSCMLQAADGDVPEGAQVGLKATYVAQDYFLSCSCRPNDDMRVARIDNASLSAKATVHSIDALNSTVARLRLIPQSDLAYNPGQFLNLVREDGLLRSYSVASVPALDDFIELHIARVEGGRMSGWVHDTLQPGDVVELRGPQGDCFYTPGEPDKPLFLLGTGTGLAPLYGIVRDALHQCHQASIHLFSGSLALEGLYLVDELRALAEAHANFHYYPCALRGEPTEGIDLGAVDEFALQTVPDLKGHRVYLCGAPDMVRLMQRKTFLAGATMKEILADAFLESPA
jgi:NAD(P)H-flavin reductase/ferredoxin